MLKVQSYRYVCGRQPIKRELMEQGPGVLSVRVSEAALRDREKVRQGRLEHGSDFTDSAHALVLLGWLDEQDTWLVQNSWSTEWGVAGVGTVPQSFFECMLVFEPFLAL
jgi:C1A family cysteine protease